MTAPDRLSTHVAVLRALGTLALGAALAPAPAIAAAQSPQWTVIAVSAPTNFKPAPNETQSVTIAAAGGTYTLTFEGQTTNPIMYNATAAVVQAELDALSTIGGVGGSVTVIGGVGDPSGANPYIVTFGGSLAGINVSSLTVNASSLFSVVGNTVSCAGGPEGSAFSYQWLRSGQPIGGATSSTYTIAGADAGDTIQCLTTAAKGAGQPASAAVSQPPHIAAPVPATPLPVPPASIPAPSGTAKAGATVKCNAGSWSQSPTFVYQWLKNGAPISGATGETYVVQAADVPSNMQCEVIGTNAGGSVAKVSANGNTSPSIPFSNRPPQATSAAAPAAVATQTQGGSTGLYKVTVMNTGGAPSDGSTVTIVDVLPSGLTLAAAGASGEDHLSGEPLSCAGLTCTYSGSVASDDLLTLKIPVVIGPADPNVTNTVTVTGGAAPEVSVSTQTAMNSTPAGFGIAPGATETALSNTQAGAHADLTTMLAFNTIEGLGRDGENLLAGYPQRTIADLPPGFVGDLADTPTCSVADFSKQTVLNTPTCPLDTQVGTTTFRLDLGFAVDFPTLPVYNLTPNPGEVARLGFFAIEFGIQGEISVRPGDYGVRTTFTNIDESLAALDSVALSIWAVPSAPNHDAARGLVCAFGGSCEYCNETECIPRGVINGQHSRSPEVPYLTNPTACSDEPLRAKLSSASWEQPDQTVSAEASIGSLTGCGLLEFSPWLTASPDTYRSDSPAGLTAEVKVPQEGLTSAEGFSAADIKNTTVTLPEGVVVNPGRASGLVACQISEDGVGQEGPASCPNASRVGEAEVTTPLLKEKLKGGVYLLQSNPPNLKLLVTAYAPARGIYVKLVGEAKLDETTGQLTTTFTKTPQLPFSDFKLTLDGGAKASLVTPATCGAYKTNADLTPWTSPVGEDRLSSSEFAVTSGPGGSPCPSSPLPFAPSLTAGSTSDNAGGFTSFSMELQRGDDQQRVQSLQLRMPAGLLGMVSKVPLCGEPQAAQGTCPAASQIGHTVVTSGPGPFPLTVPQPGAPQAPIYLTGGYKGAPYGLSVAVPVIAGPFNLGTVVVRSKIDVDPHTGQLTVTTDPLPRILDGVPTDLSTVSAVIDHPAFVFNPTNCTQSRVTGTVMGEQPDGTPGSTVAVSSPFAVTGCKGLPFKPSFTTSTQARTSKAGGASLHVKVTSGAGQANIGKVRIVLPKQLPARLTTLQKACPDSVFNVNPSACPAASAIGTAIAHTPVLTNPLTGPVYLVSHGGVAFPDAVIVLQGEGVTLYLDGNTNIRKGITSSTFNSVPDAPITSFEVTLPEGSHSAFATNLPVKAKGSMCGQSLKMPTVLTGQNGAQATQTTKIAVTGCPKKKAKKASSHRHRKGKS
jgi:uncharacterized repeat protein (TIGR01451 family)